MDDRNLWMPEESSSHANSFDKREAVAAIFRHKRLAMACLSDRVGGGDSSAGDAENAKRG